jgi:spermidine synthase
MAKDGIVFETDTAFDHYSVADTIYGGRPARILYGGNGDTAQSGLARDDKPELLFDYNQRFIELAAGLKPKNLLLIGGGAFTLPIALMKAFPALELDVVEIDGALLDIAKKYFDFSPNRQTHTYIGDGRHFLDTVDQTYDMIVLDVFNHATIPEQFRSLEAANSLHHRLHKNGVLAINVIGTLKGLRSVELTRLTETLQAAFRSIDVFPASHGLSPWFGQNFVLTAHNGRRNLTKHFRYAPVKL